MQDDLTRAIVGALRPTLGGSTVVQHGTRNAAAYDLYLKGRFFWNQRTPAALLTAAKEFGEAVRLDSTYALAYAGLADSWSIAGTFGVVPPSEAYTKARVAAERAVRLDSTLAQPHVSLAIIAMFYDWDWERGARELARAEALDPGYSETFLFRAWHEAYRGQPEAALASMRHAREIEPLNLTYNARVGHMLSLTGRYDEAERAFRATLALDSAFFMARNELARMLTWRGRYDNAVRVLAPSAVPNVVRGRMVYSAYYFGRTGNRVELLRLIDSLRARRAKGYVPTEPLIVAYTWLGNLDAAFAELDRAVGEHDFGVIGIGIMPEYAPLWKDPRINAIRRLTHLEDVRPAFVVP